jgi:hypothetical protein
VHVRLSPAECLPAFVKHAAYTLGPLFFTSKKYALSSSFHIHSRIFPHRYPRAATSVGLGPLRARVRRPSAQPTMAVFVTPLCRVVLILLPHSPSSPRRPFLRFTAGACYRASRQPEPASLLPAVLPMRRPPMRAGVHPSQLLHTPTTQRHSTMVPVWRPPARQPVSSSRAVLGRSVGELRAAGDKRSGCGRRAGGRASGGPRVRWSGLDEDTLRRENTVIWRASVCTTSL